MNGQDPILERLNGKKPVVNNEPEPDPILQKLNQGLKKKDTTPVGPGTGGNVSATASVRVGQPLRRSTTGPTSERVKNPAITLKRKGEEVLLYQIPSSIVAAGSAGLGGVQELTKIPEKQLKSTGALPTGYSEKAQREIEDIDRRVNQMYSRALDFGAQGKLSQSDQVTLQNFVDQATQRKNFLQQFKPSYDQSKIRDWQKGLIDWSIKRSQKGQKISEGLVNRLSDINDPLDAVNWLVGSLAESGVQIPAAIATFGTSSIGQEVGSIYMDGVMRIAQQKGLTPKQVIDQGLDSPAASLTYGTIAGLLDFLGAKGVVNVSKGDLAKSLRQRTSQFLKEFGEAGLTESGTEFSQTVLEQVGTNLTTGDSNIDLAEAGEAAAKGFVGGGGVSAVMQGVKAITPKKKVPSEVIREQTKNVNTNDLTTAEKAADVIQQTIDSNEAAKVAQTVEPGVTATIPEATKKEALQTPEGEEERLNRLEQWKDSKRLGGDEIVTVYRTVKQGDNQKEIRPGDWVSVNREYVEQYGEPTDTIIETQIPANELADAETGEKPGDTLIYVPKQQTDALREPSTSSVLQREQIQPGETRGGRGQMEQGIEGTQVAETQKEKGAYKQVIEKPEITDVKKHAEYIRSQFVQKFTSQGVSQQEAEAAVQLMEARAKKANPKNPDEWYQKIEDVKTGEFQEGTPRLLQLPDGRKAVGMTVAPEVVNGFYSPIEKRVTEFKQEKASANKWKEIVGAKDEAQFTGVREWLDTLKPDQTVSRKEILDFMKNNRIEVVEVVKSGDVSESSWMDTTPLTDEPGQELSRFGEFYITKNEDGFYELHDDWHSEDVPVLVLDSPDYTLDEAKDFFSQEINNEENLNNTITKYQQFQLSGDKSNYREVLVVMPEKTSSTTEVMYDDYGQPTTNPAYEPNKVTYKGRYKSSHWDEPNILVHLRMNTRKDSKGNKVLFIEEIQSDWGQQGKKSGFGMSELTPAEIQEKKEINERTNQAQPLYNRMLDLAQYIYGPFSTRDQLKDLVYLPVEERIKLIEAKYKQISEDYASKKPREWQNSGFLQKAIDTSKKVYEKQLQTAKQDFDIDQFERDNIRWHELTAKQNKKTIPTAPFVTDTNAWTKLGLKYALREAVKQNADAIAWTTGEQQNERYDLSKQVKKIEWNWDGNEVEIQATEINGNPISMFRERDNIESVLGKEISQKINNEIDSGKNEGEISGDGLKIGGKGMKGFYDKIVPDVAKALVKELTGKPGEISQVNINTGKPVKIDAIKYDGTQNISRVPGNDYIEDGDWLITVNDKIVATAPYTITKQQAISDFKYDVDSGNWAEESKGGISTQQAIEITSELKAAVRKGMPLFQEGKGAVETLPSGKKIIHALKKPDFSTAVHEIAHLFEDELTAKERQIIQDWAGTPDNWNTDTSEVFARGFERYLRDGKAPSKELKSIFQKAKEWLERIYNTIIGTPLEKDITPAVKKVFDNLFTIAPQGTKVAEHKGTAILETDDAETFQIALSRAVSKRKDDALQVEVKSVEAYQEILDEGGKLYIADDGSFGGFVDNTGYMGSIFKDPDYKEKGVAGAILNLMLKNGGRWMDSFATYLEELYVKNDFRPVGRLKFDPEQAPPGWDDKGSTIANQPDIVFYAYDPIGEYKAGDGQMFEKYDEVYTFTREYVEANEEVVGPYARGEKGRNREGQKEVQRREDGLRKEQRAKQVKVSVPLLEYNFDSIEAGNAMDTLEATRKRLSKFVDCLIK